MKKKEEKKKNEKSFEHGVNKILRLIESLSSLFQNDDTTCEKLVTTRDNTFIIYNTYSEAGSADSSIILDHYSPGC